MSKSCLLYVHYLYLILVRLVVNTSAQAECTITAVNVEHCCRDITSLRLVRCALPFIRVSDVNQENFGEFEAEV